LDEFSGIVVFIAANGKFGRRGGYLKNGVGDETVRFVLVS